MKPEAPAPRLSPEQSSVQGGSIFEQAPSLPNPELDFNSGAERYERKSETSAILADVSFTSALPTPVINNVSVGQNTTSVNTPNIAKDDDLIEREWVDRAKKIVAETRDNPYQREEAVNKLQIDYLKKRYGRELGVAE